MHACQIAMNAGRTAGDRFELLIVLESGVLLPPRGSFVKVKFY